MSTGKRWWQVSSGLCLSGLLLVAVVSCRQGPPEPTAETQQPAASAEEEPAVGAKEQPSPKEGEAQPGPKAASSEQPGPSAGRTPGREQPQQPKAAGEAKGAAPAAGQMGQPRAPGHPGPAREGEPMPKPTQPSEADASSQPSAPQNPLIRAFRLLDATLKRETAPGGASRPPALGPFGLPSEGEVEPPPVGEPAPEIVGVDLDGIRFKLSDYRGKVVVLDFWGDW